MDDLIVVKCLKYGITRKKVNEIMLSLCDIKKINDNEWSYRVITKGPIDQDREFKAASLFECFTLGLAGLRQTLRLMLQESPKTKFYDELDGELDEVTIEEIFWTHDCVPQD